MSIQKKNFLFLAYLFLFIFPCVISCAEQQEWYSLSTDEKYITDFKLAAGDTQYLTIESNTKIWVGFKANIAYEQFKQYSSKNIYPINIKLLVPEQNTTSIGQSRTTGFSGINGGSTVFEPIDGKIELEISNNSIEEFEIVIYTKEYGLNAKEDITASQLNDLLDEKEKIVDRYSTTIEMFRKQKNYAEYSKEFSKLNAELDVWDKRWKEAYSKAERGEIKKVNQSKLQELFNKINELSKF